MTDSWNVFPDVRLTLEENRLKTFNTPRWPFKASSSVSKEKMAEAGFFRPSGKGFAKDNVQCAFCFEYMYDWKDGENPFEQHLQNSPICSFAKLQRPQSKITMLEYLEAYQDREALQVHKRLHGPIEAAEKEFRENVRILGYDYDELHKKYLKSKSCE